MTNWSTHVGTFMLSKGRFTMWHKALRCVSLQKLTQKFLIKKFSDFLAIRCKNATQRNAKIESEFILMSRCVATNVNVKVTQCNAWYSVVLSTDLQRQLWLLQYIDDWAKITPLRQSCTNTISNLTFQCSKKDDSVRFSHFCFYTHTSSLYLETKFTFLIDTKIREQRLWTNTGWIKEWNFQLTTSW